MRECPREGLFLRAITTLTYTDWIALDPLCFAADEVRRVLKARWLVVAMMAAACGAPRPAVTNDASHDVVIVNGTIYDGTGAAPQQGDVAIDGDTLTVIGAPRGSLHGRGRREIDASGLAVAPGFINMLSQGDPLLVDGRGLSDLRQGVTLEIFGEGESFGPLTPAMKKEWSETLGDVKYDITWTKLSELLDMLVGPEHGVSPNVGSFIGAATVRTFVLGHDARSPSAAELARMQSIVDEMMREGALGIGSALIYEPGLYATTDELVALMQAAAPYDGLYISHMRSEGDRLLEGIDELVTIARRANVRAEIYHLKAAGEANWGKVDAALERIEAARASGLAITANMYPYTAAASGLDIAMPPWVREGGYDAWAARLRDPKIRARVAEEMRKPGEGWENFWFAAGSPDRIQVLAFKNPALKKWTGKTLAEIARIKATTPEEAAMDLVAENGSRVEVAYFTMSEANVKRAMQKPWVSFCSDAEATAPEGVFLLSSPHPRAYGTFARVLGKYARDERVLSLTEAIRRMTSLPASNLRIERRGKLERGYFADVAVFDPSAVADHATYESPHQLATGVKHVLVNGAVVIAHGQHTGAKPGRVVRGKGYTSNLKPRTL